MPIGTVETGSILVTDLDVNGFSIISSANGNILVTPNGSGKIKLGLDEPGTLNEVVNIPGRIDYLPVIDMDADDVSGITLTEGVGGSLSAGEYHYDFHFITADGHTGSIFENLGVNSIPDITVLENAKVTVSGIPVSPDSRVTGRVIQRSVNPGDIGQISRIIITINDNTTTTWEDDGSLVPSGRLNLNLSNNTAGGFSIGGERYLLLDEDNLAFGFDTLLNDTAAYGNVAVGPSAGSAITTGEFGTYVGFRAGANCTTTTDNTFVGNLAGLGYTTGEGNMHIGANTSVGSGAANEDHNVMVGNYAGYLGPHSAGDTNNTYVGYRCGRFIGGATNVFVGYRAAHGDAQTENNNNNVVIGAESAIDMDGATFNIIIGYGVALSADDVDYELNIGDTIKGTLDQGGGEGALEIVGTLKVDDAITSVERASDPANPAEGEWVIWMSDGTGSGDDGDIMVKITAGATTKTITLIDFSAF